MGFGRRFAGWIHKCYVKLREYLGIPKYADGRYDNYEIYLEFVNGGHISWKGKPWGSHWEEFKGVMWSMGPIRDMWTNMHGDFWEGGPSPYSLISSAPQQYYLGY